MKKEGASKGKTIRVSYDTYARILHVKGKLLLKDKRTLEKRRDYSDDAVINYLLKNLNEIDV